MAEVHNIPTIVEPKTSKVSKWATVKQNIDSGFLNHACEHRILRRKICASFSHESIKDKDSLKRDIMDLLNDPEVLRRLSVQEDSRTQIALQELMTEMMDMFSEMNKPTFNRTDSMKKLKGIIKKTMNCDCGQKSTKPRNSVHFSDENIYFEIPRRRRHKFNVATDKCTHYCCFGFLFPT